jgi:hypothetical protein
MTKRIQIFKPGTHTAMNGSKLAFSESVIAATVAAYEPSLHEAPLVIGHPKTEDPAWGWVKSLSYSDGHLYAEPGDDLDPEFAELVNQGKFKKVSASFYAPDAPNNPVPGVYYLRHVGFLGAQPPAVKGMKSASFADGEEGVIEFADWDQMTIANLFRRVREMVIAKFSVEDADKHLPEYEINSLQINAVQDDERGGMKPYFSEQPNLPQGDDMSAEEKARLAQLEAENKTLKGENDEFKAKEASFAEAESKRKVEAAHTDNVNFAESLIKQGKLLPAHKDSTVALLDKLATNEDPLEFGEGDAKKSDTPLAIYKAQLSAAPKLVDFSEKGKGAADEGVVNFAAPQGFTVDTERLELHNKALAYAEANKVTYEVALTKVNV